MSIKSTCNYKVHEILGQGTYGTVYRTVDLATHKTYAVKVQNNIDIDDMNEIIAIRSLININIISFIEVLNNDSCLDGAEIGMVMPIAEMSLYDVIKNGKIISDTYSLMYQLCEAVSYMHCAGILHLDIKPQNILVFDNMSRFVLADFGLCMFGYTGETLYSNRQRITPGYQPPEMFMNSTKEFKYAYNTKTDSYSLGIALIYAITSIAPPVIDYNDVYSEEHLYSTKIYRDILFYIQDWMEKVEDDWQRDVLQALTEMNDTKRTTASAVFGMPYFAYFGDKARGVDIFDKKRINYEELSLIDEARVMKYDEKGKVMFWHSWKSEIITIRALIRCIDLFYLLAPYIKEINQSVTIISIGGIEYTNDTVQFSSELTCLAKAIENDPNNVYTEMSPMMMAWIKATDALLYRRIITDVSRDIDDFVNVIRMSQDILMYEKNRMIILNDGKAKSVEDLVHQRTLYTRKFSSTYDLPEIHLQVEHAFLYAVHYGNIDAVNYLLDTEENLTVKQSDLSSAVHNGHLEVLKTLLKYSGMDLTDFLCNQAINTGNVEMVRYFESNGFDVIHNENVLFNASKHGHLQLVKYLVENGANVHTENDEALIYAVQENKLEIVKYLVEVGKMDIHNGYMVYIAASNGYLDILKYLVKKGANFRYEDEAPLIRAAAYGHNEIVEYLLSIGSDVHAKNDQALYNANANKHMDVVATLIANGATMT